MKDETDFLWGMFQEHTTHGRHHETQRANVTNFIIIVAGGTLGFIANNGVKYDQWIIAVFIIIIGVFGALFSAKQYERFRFHMIAAGNYRVSLEKILNRNINDIRDYTKEEHAKKFSRILIKLRLYYFWISLHILISCLGFALLYMTLKTCC